MEVSYPGGSLLGIVVGFTGLFIISMGAKSTNTERVQGQVKFRPSEGHKRFTTQITRYPSSSMGCYPQELLPLSILLIAVIQNTHEDIQKGIQDPGELYLWVTQC